MTGTNQTISNSAAVQLKKVANAAFLANPSNCSGAVHDVIKKLVDAQFAYRQANQLILYLANPAHGWKQVGLKKASELADQGKVVVGGMAEPSGHGHVIIVLPGRWKPAGGYMADGRLMPFVGLFPPAMSTALAPPGHKPWPGAVSDSDKTVYDPWFNARKFPLVRFWTYDR
ncbi:MULTISPECIES: hypothetical protein [Acidiphilium]|uniref:hypothetical protein n=1 Tax=Acidiphilium TaxID=522 RepID=UPI00257A3C7B|nr:MULTISPECIES: hypothetical protein [Acidiphilium]HQT83581.1 hypothetical protein [Acidiphilium rubrum]